MVMQRAAKQFLGVSEVLSYLRETLDYDELLQDVWVRGEISQFYQAASGHWYFTLKDAEASLKGVIFRQRNASMVPLRTGQDIFAHGRVTIYAPRGELQMTVDQIEDVGVGLLYQRFLALRDELAAMGLFAQDRKRPLPVSPATIGIVTSPDAAALRDILKTLRLRWPLARVVLAPTLVQGNEAPGQIIRAIDNLNRFGQVEVIVIARGGGSIEDLWAFNDREVALAIARSTIPTITGVGHETDFTIADFVADARAATPTAAAAAISPDIIGLRLLLDETRLRLAAIMQDHLATLRAATAEHLHRLSREHPRERATRARQQLNEATLALQRQMAHRVALEQERLSGAALRLQSLSPLLTIARGYATLTRDRDQAPVSATTDVTPPEAITIRVRDGTLAATVTAAQQT
jgi:exodeoxyribonuclease VII large subunit